MLSMQQPDVPPFSRSGPFPSLSPVHLSLQPADLLTKLRHLSLLPFRTWLFLCRASKVLLYPARDHFCACLYKAVNPLRPKLLITRKTFKAHGPLKWLKYTSV